jgi:putative tricarboxylic transport membrane protein
VIARSRIHPGEAIISLALIALVAYVVYETQSIAETQGFAQVGPRLFPYIIGTGLTLCGAVLGWHAVSGGWRNLPLSLHMVLIGWAGFIIASIVLFVFIARGFGSRKPVRDLGIAVVLANGGFFIFTQGLGLNLPAGPFGLLAA